MIFKPPIKDLKQKLKSEGFCFLPKIFNSDRTNAAHNGLSDVIQWKYETGNPQRLDSGKLMMIRKIS